MVAAIKFTGIKIKSLIIDIFCSQEKNKYFIFHIFLARFLWFFQDASCFYGLLIIQDHFEYKWKIQGFLLVSSVFMQNLIYLYVYEVFTMFNKINLTIARISIIEILKNAPNFVWNFIEIKKFKKFHIL